MNNTRFDYSSNMLDGKFWMYSEEYGEPESVCVFVQSFLKRWRPDGHHVFTWCTHCDSLRENEFRGGTCFITADGYHCCDGSCVIPEKIKKEMIND